MKLTFLRPAGTAVRIVAGLWLTSITGAALAAHPLITEDTGTQGAGHSQFELTAEYSADTDGTARTTATGFASVLSLGVTDQTDFIVTLPYGQERVEENGLAVSEQGGGDIGVDLKWRFAEFGRGASMALKSGVTTSTGDEDRGLGTGRTTYSAILIATIDPPEWAINLHLGRIWNFNNLGEREELWHASVGGWRQFGRLRMVVDLGRTTNPDFASSHPLGFLIGGFIYSVTQDFDIDLGLKVALTQAETDDAVLGGVTLRF